jgi:hypothetical protein
VSTISEVEKSAQTDKHVSKSQPLLEIDVKFGDKTKTITINDNFKKVIVYTLLPIVYKFVEFITRWMETFWG